MSETIYSRHWTLAIHILSTHTGKNLSQLHNALRDCGYGVSERTVRRDLEALIRAGFPIYHETSNGKTLWKLAKTPATGAVPPPIEPIELVSLAMARFTFQQPESKVFFHSLTTLLQKLLASHNDEFKKYINKLQKAVYVQSTASHKGASVEGIYDKLLYAAHKRLKIRAAYQKPTGNCCKDRVLAPVGLWMANNGALYLAAYCYEKNAVRVFRVSRFRKIDVLQENFETGLAFDISTYASEVIGAFHTAPEDITLEIRDVLLAYLEENPIHNSQRIRRTDEGQILLSLRVGINETLIHKLMGFGPLVRVVQPEKLARLLCERHREALNYQQELLPRASAPATAMKTGHKR